MRRLASSALFAVAWLIAPSALATPSLFPPWPCGVSNQVTVGRNQSVHTGTDAWAWDFGLDVGDVVVAPADGKIRMVKDDSSSGGCSSAYANSANYVIVAFGDGTEALIMHLMKGSVPVHVGDKVTRGDPVGKIGLTGWVCGDHLHFQIQKTCGSWWCQSIPASFQGIGNPGDGAWVKSNNCPQPDKDHDGVPDANDNCEHFASDSIVSSREARGSAGECGVERARSGGARDGCRWRYGEFAGGGRAVGPRQQRS